MARARVILALCGVSAVLTAGCGSGGSIKADRSPSVRSHVTILHLGDSHTAADHFSGHLRTQFQERFGRGQRGMLAPGAIYKGYRPHQVKLDSRGDWRLFDAWRDPDQGPYGLSGYKLVSDQPQARLTYELASGDGFRRVRLGLYGGPETGSLRIETDGGESFEIVTHVPHPSYVQKVVRLDSNATRLTLAPTGDGAVALLSVGLERPGEGGVTYVSHGVPGATVALLTRMDDHILKRELAALDPALVILAFGTNEGFNDTLDEAAYRQLFADQVARIAKLAPGARITVAGPPDANRLSARAGGQEKARSPRPCLETETTGHSGPGSKPPSYWSVPGNLEIVRRVQRQVAESRGLAFWDWSTVMGGPCGMHDWVNTVPPRAFADHVHMTDEGAAESARRFFDALMNVYGDELASLMGASDGEMP